MTEAKLVAPEPYRILSILNQAHKSVLSAAAFGPTTYLLVLMDFTTVLGKRQYIVRMRQYHFVMSCSM